MTRTAFASGEGAAPEPRAESARPRTRSRDLRGAVLLAVVAFGAALAYAPWQRAPLEKLVADFLPLIDGAASVGEAFAAMHDFYKADGRFQPIYMLALAAEHQAFGVEGRPWYVVAFLLVVLASALAAWLFRRLGASPLASAMGGGLLLLGQAAGPAILVPWWIAEPLSTIPLLGAAHLAVGYRDAERYRIRGAAIALCMAAAVLAKETTIAAMPFVMLVALLCSPDGWRPPRFGRRVWWLGTMLGATTAALGAALLLTRMEAPAMSYGATYGVAGWPGIRHVILMLQAFSLAAVMPWVNGYANLYGRSSLASIDRWAILYPPNLLLLATIGTGLWIGLRGERRRHVLLAAGTGFVLLAGGIMIYMPWPAPRSWYGFPYLVGWGLMLAVASTVLESRRRGRAAAYGAFVLIAAVSLLDMRRARREGHALRRLDREVLAAFPAHSDAGEILLAASSDHGGRARMWRRWSNVLLDEPMPMVHTVRCADVPSIAASGRRVLLVLFTRECPGVRLEHSVRRITTAAGIEAVLVRPDRRPAAR